MTPKTERRPSCRHQGGQSTVEFAVLALVLVPLLLILPLIGKYMDIAQTTAVASRYVAFEGTSRHSSSSEGWKSDVQLAREIRRRFFSNSDAPVKTDDTAGDFSAHRNTLWFDHHGAPLIPLYARHVTVTTTRESMAQPPGAAFAGEFGLPRDNLLTGNATVSIADVTGLSPFDSIGLSIGRSTTLLVDTWAAGGPGDVTTKVKHAGAAFPYQGLEVAAAVLAPFITIFEFNSSPPEVGKVEPDRVPADRLGPPR